MDSYQLSDEAIFDIDAIWVYLLEKEGMETADRIVTELFMAFYRLAEMPNSGHRRADLTSKEVLFHGVFSYLVFYEPGSNPLQILGILHGKRNISRLLKRRL